MEHGSGDLALEIADALSRPSCPRCSPPSPIRNSCGSGGDRRGSSSPASTSRHARREVSDRDAAPGGRALFYLAGELREVDPPARLAYTFAWEDPDPDDVENLVVLSFRDLGESTEVALFQAPFETEARRQLHHDGWSESFDKLERVLSVHS